MPNRPRDNVINILISVVFAIAIGLAVTVTTSASAGYEFWIARLLYLLAAISVAVAYFLWIATHSEASISTVSFGLVAAVLIVIGIPASFYWVDRREHPPISIAYVVPAFWQASPSAKWFMMIQHCGPEPVYNVDTIFIDEDRAKQISTHTTVTPAEINAEQVTLHYDEIDPAQGGSAKLFPWTPLNADEEHYSARIVSRYATFDETLQIVRVSQKWRYKMKVSDVTRSRPIIDCQDAGFPEPPVNPRPVCFPRYVSEHQGVCD
jgi:heme/copper-type cytochrome/quinol oxidase subunit 4